MVQKTLLILPQPVVVLVGGRSKGCAYGVELRVAGPTIVLQTRSTGFVIEFILRPARKLKQLCAIRIAKGDMRARSGTVEVFAYVDHGVKRRRPSWPFSVDADNHERRAVNVGLCCLA
jgi:hypothetical protein